MNVRHAITIASVEITRSLFDDACALAMAAIQTRMREEKGW